LNHTRTTPPCYNNTTLGNHLYAWHTGPNVTNLITDSIHIQDFTVTQLSFYSIQTDMHNEQVNVMRIMPIIESWTHLQQNRQNI